MWRGIRYATAARFAPPVPVEAWTGTRSATRPGAQAPQLPSILDRMLGPASLPQHEECLTLDVWAPPPEPGAATGPCLDPWRSVHERDRRRTLVRRRGVRAGRMRAGHLQLSPGRLGFLAARARPGRREPRAARPDRRAHLVQIAAFGGDPGNVTAFGESAGALGIVALLTSPLAEGRFDRLGDEPVAVAAADPRTGPRRGGRAGDVKLSVDDADAWRALPVDALLAAQAEVLGGKDPFTAFAPTPDDIVVPAPG